MLRIGMFARLSRVSVKTLRYYDAIGLLKPRLIDPETGYRRYGYDQLSRLGRILTLKAMGLSLAEVARLLDEDVSASDLLDMLRTREGELHQQAARIATQIDRLRAHIRELEREGEMTTCEIQLKSPEGQILQTITVPVAPAEADRDFLIRINSEAQPELLVCATHTGSPGGLFPVLHTLHQWIEANGYQVVGPPNGMPERRIERPVNEPVEIQLPVARRMPSGESRTAGT